MAMMISKFHKLIQSRVVWYIILGIIVITFVGFFTPTMSSGSKQPKQRAVGELYGEKVMPAEFRHAYQNTRLWYVLSSGRAPQMTEEIAELFYQNAWLRVAALRKAAVEGITASDDEVVEQIQRLPLFQGESGVYNPQYYQMALQSLGISSTQMEEAFREQLIMHKLMMRPAQAALISPDELRRAYHLYTDRFVLDYALLPREQIEEGVTVTREDAEALFNDNLEAFRMPPKVRVSYVEWKVADFVEQAEVPEGAALQFYNQNIESYRIETTNETVLADYTPFEEVEEEINAQIRKAVARRAATEEAAALVTEIAPQTEGDQPDFAGAVAAAGLSAKTLPAFGLTDELAGIDETAPFRQAASRLQNDAYGCFSDAVVGEDSVYVIYLEQRYDSFIPDFEVVEDKVMQAARAQAVAKAGTERAGELQEEISAALAAGSTFADALKPYGLEVQATGEFEVTAPPENEYADVLLPICLNKAEGELCQIVPVEKGLLIAFVAQRTETDIELGLPAVRQELIQGLVQNRSGMLVADWREALLRDANFKDLTKEQ